MYPIQRTSRSEFVPIRQLQYHVRQWGTPSPDAPPLVLVHGWMDVAASFQFVVDALSQDHWVIAPDWRGFGLTETPATDNFWFPDYLADLDFLLDHYVGDQPVHLVEGFGMPASRSAQAPGRYAKWMDELKGLQRGEMELKPYDSLEAVAQRLIKTNPRLGSDQAHWLAQHWARANAQGEWRILGHAGHKVVNAQLFRVDEVQAIYQRISAPMLCVVASSDSLGGWWKGKYTLEEFKQRIAVVPQVTHAVIQDDQPQALAELIESFL